MHKERNYAFSQEKDKKLIAERGIGFEHVIRELEAGRELDIVEHPNIDRYPHQRVFIVKLEEYVYAVPFVEVGSYYFLKTIFPSRKLTKKYLSKKQGKT